MRWVNEWETLGNPKPPKNKTVTKCILCRLRSHTGSSNKSEKRTNFTIQFITLHLFYITVNSVTTFQELQYRVKKLNTDKLFHVFEDLICTTFWKNFAKFVLTELLRTEKYTSEDYCICLFELNNQLMQSQW